MGNFISKNCGQLCGGGSAKEGTTTEHSEVTDRWAQELAVVKSPERPAQQCRKKDPPGSLGLVWIGCLVQFWMGPTAFVSKKMKEHGHVFKTKMLGQKVVIVTSRRGMEEFMHSDNWHLHSTITAYSKFVKAHFPNTLLMQEGEAWERPRRAIVAGFLAVANKDSQLVYDVASRHFSTLARQAPTQLWGAMSDMVTEALHRTILGSDMSDAEIKKTVALSRLTYAALIAVPININVGNFQSAYSKGRNARNELYQIAVKAIERRLGGKEITSDVLGAFCPHFVSRKGVKNSQVPMRITVEELAAQMMPWLIVVPVAFCHVVGSVLYQYSFQQNKELWQRLCKEVRAVPDAKLTTDIDRLPLLDGTIKEILRMYPPIFGGLRGITKDHTHIDNYCVHKGWFVLYASSIINCDPTVYEEPGKFKPERWLNIKKSNSEIFNTQHFSFGGGERICPAVDYSLKFSKLCVAALIRSKVDFKPKDVQYLNPKRWKKQHIKEREGIDPDIPPMPHTSIDPNYVFSQK